MNEPLTDYLDVLSENHMGSRKGDWRTGCGADWPCLERQAIEELRQHRAEGVNHHTTACMTCMATDSELITLQEVTIAQDASIVERDIALRELREAVHQDATDAATVVALYAERDMLRESVVAQDASIVERDIAIIELREQISALKRKRIYSDPIAAQLETLRQMMQRTLVDGNPRAVAETLIDRLYAYTIGLEEQNAKLVAQIHGIADTYRTCGMSRETADAILVTAMANDWPDATQDAGASVKGEQE